MNGHNILAIILARGGSKGVPKKNIKNLNGKPLMVWSIEAAQNSKYVSRTVVSSDDKEIIEVAKKCKVDTIERPVELATDEASSEDAIMHVLDTLESDNYIPDYVMLLQPTSPLRDCIDVDSVVELLLGNSSAELCKSVCEIDNKFLKTFIFDDDKFIIGAVNNEYPYMPRQILPQAFLPNGAIYMIKTEAFKRAGSFISNRTLPYIMPLDKSVDIDTQDDFDIAEGLLRKTMKKICWIQHASEWPLYIPLAKELKSMGVESVFVCKTKTVFNKYKNEGFEAYFISEIFYTSKSLKNDEVAALDKKYGPPGVGLIGDSDVQLKEFYKNKYKRDELIAKALIFWEDFFNKQGGLFVIARETATFATRTAYLVARKRSIKFSWLDYGPVDETFVLCDVSERYLWSELDEQYSNGKDNLSSQEEKYVEKYVEDFLNKSRDVKPVRFIPNSLIGSLKSLFSYTLKDNKKNRNSDPILVASLLFGRKKLLKRMNWHYITRYLFKYDEIIEGEPFVYCPIYSGEEAGYLTAEHYWARNQFDLVKEVAMNLPAGYFLYLKEHPWNPGEFSYKELKELQRIKNIRIVDPRINGNLMINKSKVVVVLQSFSGWEAYIHKKPVVAIGAAFYTFTSMIYRVENINNLSFVLWRAIEKGSEIYKENEDEWKLSIHSILTSGRKGVFVNKKPPYGFPDDKENAHQIALSIFDKINKM